MPLSNRPEAPRPEEYTNLIEAAKKIEGVEKSDLEKIEEAFKRGEEQIQKLADLMYEKPENKEEFIKRRQEDYLKTIQKCTDLIVENKICTIKNVLTFVCFGNMKEIYTLDSSKDKKWFKDLVEKKSERNEGAFFDVINEITKLDPAFQEWLEDLVLTRLDNNSNINLDKNLFEKFNTFDKTEDKQWLKKIIKSQ